MMYHVEELILKSCLSHMALLSFINQHLIPDERHPLLHLDSQQLFILNVCTVDSHLTGMHGDW